MPEFDYHGVSVTYDRAGSGDPILFLHNLGGDRHIWAHQTRSLAATHSVYALDLFGYGDSDSPTSGYTVENYVRMVEEFIDAHALTNLTMVGNCFGSAASLLYARRNPQQVRALVLCNPLTAATLRPTLTGLGARLATHLPIDSVAGAIRLPGLVAKYVVREQLGPRGRDMDASAFANLNRRWRDRGRLLAPAATARDLSTLAALDEFRPDADFPPITTIWGLENRVLSAAAGARLNATLNPTLAIEARGCGHLVMLEEPETVTAAIRSATRTALAG
ncbi:alpha/beta fold hydrolase [Nocardia sp. ET3-3]|uniref:Alpha/beta fold hydrolase n=1 Tax=Nocardia terrae TaxID=2675851 RepID=A0A7K1UV76_9NOCA|nr:alpha/beta hydrolase [Nocardia terrae]MVU77798.1 alpha/beta fold hydrolase [Nocardia terrae]